MAIYDLEEQEQLEALKAWWKESGTFVLWAIAIALMLTAGWTGWRWYQRNQATQAAALYENLQSAARTNDIRAVAEFAGNILQKYPRTAYAPLAALVSARASYRDGEVKTARAQLRWVVEHAHEDGVRAIARLRLAAVLLDQKAYGEAMNVLKAKPEKGFDALYASMRGDILAARNKRSEARAAYEKALKTATDATFRETVKLKLEALGGA